MPVDGQWRQFFDELAAAGRAATASHPAEFHPAGDPGRAAPSVPPAAYWFAAENLRAIESLYPSAGTSPHITLPASLARVPVERDDAILAAARGHMEYLGPISPAALASMLSLGEPEVMSALARLEGEGVVLRGRFTPPEAAVVGAQPAAAGVAADGGVEFCDRRLLARIHRYTLDRLRSEIEPVSAQDFMRYLLHRHRAGGARRAQGKRGLLDVVAQLQGFEVPAVAWERDVLPLRVAEYDQQWLDDLCLAGDVAWTRLTLRKSGTSTRGVSASRATPMTLALRRDLPALLDAARGEQQPEPPSAGAASEVYDALKEHGALFFDDLLAATHVLPAQLEEALWELVARGLVTSDGFSPLRHIMMPKRTASQRRHARYGGGAGFGRGRAAPQGRWALVHRFSAGSLQVEELAEHAGMQLLARYGVVFRDLVAREHLGVQWRDIVRALRRQEARGVVRGGRFVAGFVGEQYALPEAVEALRRIRKQERTGEIVRVNAADPLNLAGIITPGPRVAAVHTNAVTYRDGLPITIEEGNNVRTLEAPADFVAPLP
jgi:ATP-dependent Lhr-like helicase